MIYEKGYDEDLKRRQQEHLKKIQMAVGSRCPLCNGTGVKKNGQKCVHERR